MRVQVSQLFQEGEIALQSGRYEDAARCFQEYLKENPEHSPALHGLGLVAFHLGQVPQSIDLITRALQLNPEFSEGFNSLGVILRRVGRIQESESLCRRALEIQSDNPEAAYNLGNALLDQDRLREALEAFSTAIRNSPDYARAWNNKAIVLHRLGRMKEAGVAYEESLRLDSGNSQAWNNYGNFLHEQGQLEAGVQAYRRGIELHPRDTQLIYHLATAQKFQNQDSDLSSALKLHGGTDLSDAQRVPLCFALGKMYEDLQDFSTSFKFYAEGNQIYRSMINYELAQDQALFTRIISEFTAEGCQRTKGSQIEDRVPVFILGMPRSGTTLVEQILAAHSKVYGGGELESLRRSTLRSKLWPKGLNYPYGVSKLGDSDFTEMGRAYFHSLPEDSSSYPVITDKMPQNFIILGLIPLLFKDYRIIHCRREAMDTCWSCYRQFFDQVHGYSYDLEELGHYFQAYEALMGHWHKVFPGKILDLPYEELVENQEKWSRVLLDWCDLEFEENCLRFYEHKRVIKTASSEQVRRPIYGTSIEGWRRVEAELKPLKQALAS